MHTPVDALQVLQVASNSDADAIRRAKRRLSLATHPDKSPVPGAREAFELVTEAADHLLDEKKRVRYARDLAASVEAAAASADRTGSSDEDAIGGIYMHAGCVTLPLFDECTDMPRFRLPQPSCVFPAFPCTAVSVGQRLHRRQCNAKGDLGCRQHIITILAAIILHREATLSLVRLQRHGAHC